MFYKSLVSTAAVAAVTLCSTYPAQADQLAPIVVTAERSPTPLSDVLAPLTVITQRQIQDSGAQNIPEALSLAGGVEVHSLYGAGLRANVSLRGFGDTSVSNVLVLVNGRRLNNPDIGAIDWGAVPLSDIARIEILQGGAGVMYGDQAVGGVINIITRQLRKGLGGHAEAGAGSYGAQHAGGGLSERGVSGWSFALNGHADHADNYRDNNRSTNQRAGGQLGYDYGSGQLQLQVRNGVETLGLPGGLFADQVQADRRQTVYPNDYVDTDTSGDGLTWSQSLGEHVSLKTDYDHGTTRAEGKLYATPFVQNRETNALNPRLVANIPLTHGTARIVAGADLHDDTYDIASSLGTTSSHQRAQGYYANATLPLAADWQASLGGRVAHAENRVIDASAYPNGHDFSNDASAGEAGVAWHVTPATRLSLRFAQVFRFPKVDELSYTAPGVVGLKTQTGDSLEAGWQWTQGGRSVHLTVYQLDLHNEISFDPSAGTFGANSNLKHTRRVGAMLSARTPLSKWFTLSGSYTYVDARFASGTYDGNVIPLVAPQKLQAMLTWHAGARRVSVQADYRDPSYGAGDYTNALAKLPARTAVNLTGEQRFGHWALSGRIGNLFDARYSDYAAKSYNPAMGYAPDTAYYPAPERNFSLTLRTDF
ncbi:MAG: TonB-dependent receptor [Acidihalobacter sp.]